MQIHPCEDSVHRVQVIQLWQLVFAYTAAHNDPAFTIDPKWCAKDGLFFVAIREERVMGTAMAGYDGHRGWLYVIAVHPDDGLCIRAWAKLLSGHHSPLLRNHAFQLRHTRAALGAAFQMGLQIDQAIGGLGVGLRQVGLDGPVFHPHTGANDVTIVVGCDGGFGA